MKHEFRLTRPAFIGKQELAAGDLVATVEVAEGLPLDRVVNAIINGHATEAPASRPDKPTPAPKK
jgi:hypothetical protein